MSVQSQHSVDKFSSRPKKIRGVHTSEIRTGPNVLFTSRTALLSTPPLGTDSGSLLTSQIAASIPPAKFLMPKFARLSVGRRACGTR